MHIALVATNSNQITRPRSPAFKAQSNRPRKEVPKIKDIAQVRMDLIASIYKTKQFLLRTNKKAKIQSKNHLPLINGLSTTKNNKKSATNIMKGIKSYTLGTNDYNKGKDLLSTRQTLHE